jgi:outer membrane usher protein
MRRRRLSLIATALLVSGPLLAQPDRMLLELCVNGSCYGTAFVLVRQEHILVDAESLGRAHVMLRPSAAETVDAQRFYEVSLLADGVKVEMNVQSGRLVLTLPPGAFGNHRIDLNAGPKVSTAAAVPSAFVNYGLNAGSAAGGDSVYLDGGFAMGRALLRDNPYWSEATGFSRGLSRLEYDEPASLARWTVGDQTASSSDGLGGSALLGGIGIARAFDLNPYLITYPQPVFTGVLQAPGTIDIYQNGVLVGQRQVPAGPFSLASLGVAAGANNVRIVVQDPFGGTTVLQQNFYGASQMLAQGLSDYAFEIGAERASTLANGYLSGRAVLLARDNYGFSDQITAGYRLEAENGLVNTGPSVSVRLPAGVLSMGVAGSRADGAGGYGASAAYQYNTRHFSVGGGAQDYSSAYLRIGDDLLPPADRTRRVVSANAAWLPNEHASVQLSFGDTVFDDGMRQRNIGLNNEINLFGGSHITLSLSRQINQPGPNDNQITLTFVMPLGGGSFGVEGTHDQNGGNNYGLFAQRSVPSNAGWGYNVNVQDGSAGATGLGQVSYQNQYGLAQLTAQRFSGESAGSVLVSGSLAALDGHVFAGRTLQSGYALIETPGLADVDVTSQNLPIGRTDASGNLLVTNLLPYQINKVGINQSSVPLEFEIDATDQTVSVPRLGGTIVRFGLHALHAVRGVLRVGGKAVHYGSATVLDQDPPVKTLIGLDGSFYFSDLPGGRYTLLADTANGHLRCRMKVPASSSPVVDMGAVDCTVELAAAP